MNLENKNEQSAQRILFRLKSHGAQSTATLAGTLQLTAEAVRQQVQKLTEAGLLEGSQERSTGAGRPRQLWTLTTTGHARFPDAHAQLALDLIASVRALHGEAGMERLIDARAEENRRAYTAALQGARGLAEQVRRLAALREREGYMARAERDGRDWLLIEDHCPICAAAQSCQGFCRAELALFRAVLGKDTRVTREQHLLDGGRRCTYRITSA